MAKPLVVSHNNADVSFNLSRLERSKIYGTKKRVVLDSSGDVCTRAALTLDGSLLLSSGMTSQGYFTNEGRWVQRSEMVGIDAEGKVVETQLSTLGSSQIIEGPLDPHDLLDLDIESVYLLEPEDPESALSKSLKSGDLYRCPFRFSASLDSGTAILLANDEGFFALVGKTANAHWCEEQSVFTDEVAVDEESDDLDFDSL